MEQGQFEALYESEIQKLEKRRYHLIMPINIRVFESVGWKYTWMDQYEWGWHFIGEMGKDEKLRPKMVRIRVPKENGDNISWEWGWTGVGESPAELAKKTGGV